LGDDESVLFGLLDEAEQERDGHVRHGDRPRHAGVCRRQVVEQIDAELSHDLVLVTVEFLGQHSDQLF